MYKWEKIDSNKVCLEVKVPTEEVNEALDKAYRKIVKKVNVPGFRKGRVPRKVLETRFGADFLNQEALALLAEPAYQKAVQECQLEPIDQPEITELVQIGKDKPLIFKINVEVKPEVKLNNYLEGITVELESKEINAADVDKYLYSLRDQHARLVAVEEGEVEKKDMIVIDFLGKIDGEPFEGGEAEGYSLEIGSGSFIAGFEEQLLGARRGEEREVKSIYPENYHQKELAGKEAIFHVTIKEIKRPQLPEMNDAFVQELTEEFSTLEEFRADVEKNLKEAQHNKEKVKLETEVIEKVAAGAEVEVPEVLIAKEIDKMLGELDYYLRLQGLSLEQYGQMVEGGLEKLKEERREEARKRAKANLVLDAIIKKEEIRASAAEIEAKMKEIIERQPQEQEVELEKVREQFARQGRLDIIEHEIRYRKVIDLLVKHAEVLKVAPKAAEEKEKAAASRETLTAGPAVGIAPEDSASKGEESF